VLATPPHAHVGTGMRGLGSALPIIGTGIAVGTTQGAIGADGVLPADAGQIRTDEVDTGQIRPMDVDASQHGATQIGPTEVGEAQIGPCQISPT